MALRSVFGNRDQREKKVLTNRDYYKALLENKKEATFLCDGEGDLFLLNQKARQMTGFGEDDIRSYHVRDLFVTRKNVDNPLDVRQFKEFSAPVFLLDSQRYLLPVVLSFQEIEGQKFLCTCVEAVEKEEPARVRESLNPVKSEPVLSSTALPKSETTEKWTIEFEHRVRNLLGSILGFGSILAREPLINSDKKLASNLDALMHSGDLLKKLVNQSSMAGSEYHEVNRTPLPLSPLFQKAIIMLQPLAIQNHLTIKVQSLPEVQILTDEVLFLDLLRHLIGKALTFTRGDEVRIEVVPDPGLHQVTIRIDNLGQDIPQAVIQTIRREFNRDHYDVTNPLISLNPEISTILQILNRLEAKIQFESGPNLGEIAVVTMAMAPDASGEDDLASLEKSIRARSLQILVIEDEKFSARLLKLYLEPVAEVSLAYSGNEALNIIEIFYNRGIIFNAVLSDIGLPSPWDGILLKQEIEKRWPEYQKVPFLAQTAFSLKSYADRIMETKFRALLIKPINRLDILRFLDKYCR